MAKKVWRPGTMIYPLPAILVGCGNAPENYNLITVAWVGTICSDPAMCYVSVRKERHSYALLKENMEFTLNLTNRDMARAADWCGVRSGRDYDKFAETGLTPRRGMMVQAPYIEEAPLSIECRVKEIIPLGSHGFARLPTSVSSIRKPERSICRQPTLSPMPTATITDLATR